MITSSSNSKKRTFLYISIYYVIAMAIRYVFVILKPDFYTHSNPYIQSLLLGISPIIAGIILVYLYKRKNDLQLFSIGFWKTISVITIPLLLFTLAGFYNSKIIDITIIASISTAIVYAIFEEYGWRGYLQTELKAFKPFYKYFIVSVFWYFWHFDFGLDFNHLISYVYVLAGSIGIGFVADKSKSLILPSMLHMIFNVFFTQIDNILPYQKTGILLFISGYVIVLTIMYSKKQRQLAQKSNK